MRGAEAAVGEARGAPGWIFEARARTGRAGGCWLGGVVVWRRGGVVVVEKQGWWAYSGLAVPALVKLGDGWDG